MPRTTDWDARVRTLVAQLREALVERERARTEARVDSMVAGLLKGSGDGVVPVPFRRPGRPAKPLAAVATAKPKKRRSYKRTAAQRKASAERMRAYWAARKREKAAK